MVSTVQDRTRVVPMRVLAVGLSRTGTTSLRTALKQLGYNKTYHTRTCRVESPQDLELWMDVLRIKIDEKGVVGKDVWDRLLGHCQAVTDVPCSFFARELIEAYPEAKVILNTRDVDAWYRSLLQTFNELYMSSVWQNPLEDGHAFETYRQMTLKMWDAQWDGDFVKNGKRMFHEHHSLMKELVPKENILEWRVQDGWEPLCRFLGDPVPDEAFPKTNDTEAARTKIQEMLNDKHGKTMNKG